MVTNDLQKATSDISSISPGPSPLTKPNVSKQLAQKHALNKAKLQKSPAARQLFSNPTSSKAPLSKSPRNLPTVTNSFLKGISLLKSSNMPSVTPYTGSPALAGQTPTKAQVQTPNPRAVTAQILAQQRMTSDSASVVRMTKNITNEPVIIDIEAPSSSKSIPASSGGLQLTQPRSAPLQTMPNIVGQKPQMPKHAQPLQLTTPKPLLSVGSTNASALKSLVSKISKKPVLSIQKKSMIPPSPQKSSLEVVVLDGPGPIKTTSTPTSSMITTSPQRGQSTSESPPIEEAQSQAPPTTTSPAIPPPITSTPDSTSHVLSTLGLQPSRQASKEAQSPVQSPVSSTSSPVPPLSHLPVPSSPSRSPAGSVKSPPISSPDQSSVQGTSSPQEPEPNSQTNGLKSPSESAPSPALSAAASEASKDSTAEESTVVKSEESTSVQPQIACMQCDTPEDQKYAIPEQEAKKPAPTAEVSNTSSDTDFPSEIFAEDPPPPASSAPATSPDSEPFKSPTSLSDALHAASDALLDHT